MEFKCRFCREYFTSYAKRWMHINSVHLHCIYLCTVCSTTFNSAPPAYQHAVRAHEGQKKIIKRVSRSSAAEDGPTDGHTLDGRDERPDDFEDIRTATKKRKRKVDQESNVKNLGPDDFRNNDIHSKRAKTPSGNSTDRNTPNPPTEDNNDNNSYHSNCNKKSFHCFDCQKTFSSTWNLNRHLFIVHNIPNQNFHSDVNASRNLHLDVNATRNLHLDSNASLGSDDGSDVIAIDVVASDVSDVIVERSHDDDDVVKCAHCHIECFGQRALRNHVKFKHVLPGEFEEGHFDDGAKNGNDESEDVGANDAEDATSQRGARAAQFKRRYVWVGNKVLCTSCDKYLTYPNWHGHEDSIHQNKSYDCTKCGKTLKWRKNRVRHEDICTGRTEDSPKANGNGGEGEGMAAGDGEATDEPIIDLSENTKQGMRTRIRINPPQKLMDEFKAEADLNDEEKLENDETKEEEKDTDSPTKNEKLKEYINVVETPEKKSWICKKCHVEYNSRGGLVAHVHRRHLGTQFKCKTCARAFNYLTDLNRHVREGPCARDAKRGRPAVTRLDTPRVIYVTDETHQHGRREDDFQGEDHHQGDDLHQEEDCQPRALAVCRSLNDAENWNDDEEVKEAEEAHLPCDSLPETSIVSTASLNHDFDDDVSPTSPAADTYPDHVEFPVTSQEGTVDSIHSIAVVASNVSTDVQQQHPTTTAVHPSLSFQLQSDVSGDYVVAPLRSPEVCIQDNVPRPHAVTVKVEVDGETQPVAKTQCHFCSVLLVHASEEHKTHLLEHLEDYHSKTVCPQCLTQCNSNKAMTDHFLLAHSRLKKLLCSEENCVKTYWLSRHMDRHVKNHKFIPE